MIKGGFTLPGETGYEKLTLELAERWGADVIRDSDGTKLSDELLDSGYKIYTTICPVREHNEWIRANDLTRQQTFLCTNPKTAQADTIKIYLLDDFFNDQFDINSTEHGIKYWQVYDRTTGHEVLRDKWQYDTNTGSVTITAIPMHQYTVSFLAWRIWEEISMYNHVTNNWDTEHLLQLNPYRPEALEYLKKNLNQWCEDNPDTDVVRFTSLFYNFVWIWGSSERNRHLFTDWASYDFTVCPEALDDFAIEYGYVLSAEDFVRGGRYFSTHRIPTAGKRDWMNFIGRFVRKAGRELIDIVHAAGKKAYVFYDDNWVGLEPYNGFFDEFNFDGLVKCVFSGYEARLCAGVPVATHEIRFHPYLFPVGLGGLPTFSPGGKPDEDATAYWINIRRALLRQKIERCGLGGYLSLTLEYPKFLDAMDRILHEFRTIAALHNEGSPIVLKPKIAILHSWGKLRTWTLSGHFHETPDHILIHILESLSGLPFDVSFISFSDISDGCLDNIDVIINAGAENDAWSGGLYWDDHHMVETLTKWVHNGGAFIGIGEPSAYEGAHRLLRMSHVLGVDTDNGDYSRHGRWTYELTENPGLIPEGVDIQYRKNVMLTDGETRVLAEKNKVPTLTMRDFGKGTGIYCTDFIHTPLSPRFLLNLILTATKEKLFQEYITDDPLVEAAYYPGNKKLALINNGQIARMASCTINGKKYTTELKPFELKILRLID